MNKNVIPENLQKEIIPNTSVGCEECNYSGFKTIVKNGYEFEERCSCYKAFQADKRRIRSNIPAAYATSTFDFEEGISCFRFTPAGYKNEIEIVNGKEKRKRVLGFNAPQALDINGFGKKYTEVAYKYLMGKPRSKAVSLLLSGEVGSGKTKFACAIANEFLEKDKKVLFLKAKQYLDIIKDGYTKDEKKAGELKEKRNAINGLCPNFEDNYQLLVLDELGFEYQKADSGFALAEIKDLIRNRAENLLPTIITTNFRLNELVEMYEEEIVSTFAESYMFFYIMSSEDFRLKRSSLLDEEFDLDNLIVK